MKQALNDGRFVCVLEVVPQQSPSRLAALEHIVQRGHLAGWPLLPAFADRVGLHSDLSPFGRCWGIGVLGFILAAFFRQGSLARKFAASDECDEGPWSGAVVVAQW